MRTARRSLAVLVAWTLLACLTRPVAAGEPSPATSSPRRTAKRFLEAFRSADTPALQAIADEPDASPHDVADVLLAAHGLGATAEPPAPKDYLAAAMDYAERVRSRPEARGLPLLVATWGGHSQGDLLRDQRVRAVVSRMDVAQKQKAWQTVVDLAKETRPDLEAAPPSAAVAALHAAEGRALDALERLEDAVRAYRRAIAVCDDLRWPRAKAHHLRTVAHLEARRRRPAAAAAAYEEALAISETFGTAHAAAYTRVELAYQWHKVGRLGDALASAERGLADAEALGTRHLGRALFLLGDIRRDLGRTVDARDLYERAVVAYEAVGLRRDAALALVGSAQMRLRLRDGAGAEERFRRALEEAEAVGDRKMVAAATLGLGNALRARGAHRDAVETHRRAADLAAASGNREVGVLSLAALGWDHLELSESGPAIDAFEKAFRSAEEHGIASNQLGTAHRQLAQAYLLADRPRDALRAARAGLDVRRAGTRSLGESYGAVEQMRGRAAADEGLRAAVRLATAEPGAREEAVAAAFALTESARGVHLADAIHGDRGPSSPATGDASAEERQARERFEAARRRLLLLAFGDRGDADTLAAARAEYEAASDARRETLARAELARREPDRPSVEPLGLDAARAALPEGAVLVLYHLTEERIFAVVVARGGADLFDLGEAAPIVEAAKRWSSAASTPGGEEGTLPETLYDALLAPLEPHLRGANRLLVGRDGPIAFLPFEALVRVHAGRRQRVVEAWPVSYVTSATVYATLARRSTTTPVRDTLVALGDPVYPGEGGRSAAEMDRASDRGITSLDRLFASAEEVRDVAELFPEARRVVLLRADATRVRLASAIQAASTRLRLLHLACHGFADSRLPGRSGLVLSEADVLTVDDVARMRVPADLVVLSACESGRGLTQMGEGVLALPRAFQAAGATQVVAADRRVADGDARALLRRFYEAHLGAGLDAAAALRAAKVARIREGGVAAHPYAWAGFVLWE